MISSMEPVVVSAFLTLLLNLGEVCCDRIKVYTFSHPDVIDFTINMDKIDVDLSNYTEPEPKEILYEQRDEEFSFFFFSRSHEEGVPISDINSTKEIQSVVDPSLDLKVIVHGWKSSSQDFFVNNTIKEYLSDRNLNLVAVDWSSLASWDLYPVTTMSVAAVGHGVANLLQKFVEANVTTHERIHLIGHSLGAHVMGVAGAVFHRYTGGKVARVTGLDPAGPMYDFSKDYSEMLDPEDAEFVDVIHTSGKAFGHFAPLGHADFYPNRGTPPQPGCIKISLTLIGCSHGMSYKYYDESISNPKGFKAVQCPNWSSYNNGSCANNTIAYMGDPTPSSTRGFYYLTTNNEAPYAMG